MILISEDKGFKKRETESVSSFVFTKEEKIYKLNKRLSIERQKSDLERLKTELLDFPDHVPDTEIDIGIYDGKEYTCVIQPIINGIELKYLSRSIVNEFLAQNKPFLAKLLNFFSTAIEEKKLYPDIVGFPANPIFYNSINLMLEEKTGRMILCDVNLSPHEDTLQKHGVSFYGSSNVQNYLKEMSKFKQYLDNM